MIQGRNNREPSCAFEDTPTPLVISLSPVLHSFTPKPGTRRHAHFRHTSQRSNSGGHSQSLGLRAAGGQAFEALGQLLQLPMAGKVRGLSPVGFLLRNAGNGAELFMVAIDR
jgi:hypothetical protein